MTDRNSLAFRVTDLLVQSPHFMMSENRPRRVSAAYDLALDICNTARGDDFHPVSAAWEVFDDWLHFLRAEVGDEEIDCVPIETLTSWFADCATVEGAINKARDYAMTRHASHPADGDEAEGGVNPKGAEA